MDNKELEAKFVNIDKELLIRRLTELGAVDKGENFISDISYHDKEGEWESGSAQKFIRMRKFGDKVVMTFKSRNSQALGGTTEIEIEVSNFDKAKQILESIGLVVARTQEKVRHTFKLKNVSIDIDMYPSIPAFVEIEGPSEGEIKEVAELCGYKWADAQFGDSNKMIERIYNIPLSKYKYFTFSRIG